MNRPPPSAEALTKAFKAQYVEISHPGSRLIKTAGVCCKFVDSETYPGMVEIKLKITPWVTRNIPLVPTKTTNRGVIGFILGPDGQKVIRRIKLAKNPEPPVKVIPVGTYWNGPFKRANASKDPRRKSRK